MVKFAWNDNLSVGIELIDQQHKEWIKHFNCVADCKSASQTVKTLNFLIDYTDLHFSTEEKSMLVNKYPHYKEHKKLHDELRYTLNNLVNEYRDEGPTRFLIDSLETLMNNWFVKHIHEADKKFVDFVKENKIKISEC
jgi:hemerythrin-like metal-binding protein